MSLQPTKTATSSVDERRKKLLDALRGGADVDTATLFAGLTADEVQELWPDIIKARAEAIVRAVAQIQKAANQGDWKAAAWWLERTAPAVYSAAKQLERVVFCCAEGHTVTLTQPPDASVVCGICGSSMLRQ